MRYGLRAVVALLARGVRAARRVWLCLLVHHGRHSNTHILLLSASLCTHHPPAGCLRLSASRRTHHFPAGCVALPQVFFLFFIPSPRALRASPSKLPFTDRILASIFRAPEGAISKCGICMLAPARLRSTAASESTRISRKASLKMLPTIIKNKRGRFDGLDTKDKKAVADALLQQTEKVAVWVFDDDSLATMTKMHQTQLTKEVDRST